MTDRIESQQPSDTGEAAEENAHARAYAHARAVVESPARLAAVHATGLLHGEVEEAFDRLTRLAVRLLRVPAAFISLVDRDRDVYPSACGFGEPLATARELRGETFCHHAIQSPHPLVIDDTAADPVYRHVPTVQSLGVAAYVGMPLVVDGQAIGSFCAIDFAPRHWSPDELEVLTELAASAQRDIELRAAVRATDLDRARAEADAEELARINAELRDKTAEIEMQAEELQEATVSLEEQMEHVEHANLALRASEGRYVLAARATFNAIWDWDVARNSVTWSEALEGLFGHSLARLDDAATWRYAHIHPDDRDRVVTGIRAVIDHAEAGNDWADSYRFLRGDGTYADVVDRGYVARDDAGRAQRMVGAMEDVSSRRAAETAERDARAAAEEANRAKAHFLASMSHELRTPLNAIGGYVEILELGIHGPVTEAQVGSLGRIRRAQTHLLGLINDILSFAKLESGRVEFDVRPVTVSEVLAEVSPMVAPQMAAKGIAFCANPPCEVPRPASWRTRRDPDDTVPVVALADRDRLRQILINLLSNAAKFTRRDGAVEVWCELEDDERVRICVQDTGIGIAADALERVFEPFVQVRSELTRAAEGTGLGLAIARDLARGMGGDLIAESVLGEGSTFSVILRRAP